jgi:hypothetical protein
MSFSAVSGVACVSGQTKSGIQSAWRAVRRGHPFRMPQFGQALPFTPVATGLALFAADFPSAAGLGHFAVSFLTVAE